MERIKATGWNGIMQLDAPSGQPPLVALLLKDESGNDIAIEIDVFNAIEIVPALIASLGTLASEMTNYQILIPAAGWQVDLASAPPHQPMIHAYLQRSEGQRLSFGIHPQSLRPLARLLDRKADELEAMAAAPMPPGSTVRN